MLSEALPLAVAIAASPFPLVPSIILVLTPRARFTGPAFLGGWFLGIALVTGVCAALTETVPAHTHTPAWASWARVVLGSGLLVVGMRTWLERGQKQSSPRWMDSLETASPAKALRLGLLLSAANPKFFLLSAAAGFEIGRAAPDFVSAATTVSLFTLLASSTVAAPVLVAALFGEKGRRPLRTARDWLKRHNDALMAVVMCVIGVVMVARGLGER